MREHHPVMIYDQFIGRLKMMGVHDELKDLVERTYGATLRDVHGRSFACHVARAREHVLLILRDRFKWGYHMLGACIGRHHSTARSCVKGGEARLKSSRVPRISDRVRAQEAVGVEAK